MREKINNLNLYSNQGILYIEDIPRVTNILSTMLHEDSLMYWANSLGFKNRSYKKTLEQAAEVGTIVHNTAEKILRNEYSEPDLGYLYNNEIRNAVDSFINWYNGIKDRMEVLSMEVPVFDNYFRGTYDLLAKFNNKIFLVDFKTSNHIGARYFLQLAAYRYLIKTNFNIDIDGCMILQLSKNSIRFKEYILDFSIPEHLQYIENCQESFFSLVYAYHNRVKTEKDFNRLF